MISLKPAQLSTESRTRTKRFVFLDNLRIFLTILVIAHHAAQPYGPTGGRWLLFNPERAQILGAFFAVNAGFFMGLFFLISGYFLPASFNRKGASLFLQDRLLRLGIPIVILVSLVIPWVLYQADLPSLSFWQFLSQQYWRMGALEFAHLWFLVHLLVYAVGYTLWRWLRRSQPRPTTQLNPPSHRWIALYALGLAIVTFIIRIHYPIDAWVKILGFIPSEVAHLPQYASLFLIGILAYRHDWLNRMPSRRALLWLGIGLGAATLRYGYTGFGSDALPDLFVGGGWDGRSLLTSLWESCLCVGLCLGLLVLFRDYLNQPSRFQKMLAANAYTTYLIHIFIVIGIQFLVAPYPLHPFLKFVVVTVISTPLCFLLSQGLRQLPFASRVL
ncbi:acyltransferase family protein [Vacuolonema iberomarrocanum]|uniref:acyltransferase family protein n=1 Tax=Vacuolonema iberomarrocanum TaxID=3454632 RepID=UPI0019E3932D|nr:acyltransferase family protein [filamentous cyanobacterium LEGE 07170]